MRWQFLIAHECVPFSGSRLRTLTTSCRSITSTNIQTKCRGKYFPCTSASIFLREMNWVTLLVLVGLCSLIGTECLAWESLTPIERTVRAVLNKWPLDRTKVHQLKTTERESFAIAKRLNERLCAFRRNGDCGRCWLQQAHCICNECPPLENVRIGADSGTITSSRPVQTVASINRIFVLMHHKEICLAVDTAKLIAAALPISTRIVVGGIGNECQESMREMQNCIRDEPASCIVLFPSEDARTYKEIMQNIETGHVDALTDGWNVIVVDGTWEQARKLYNRYLSPNASTSRRLIHVKLSDSSLASILPTPDLCERQSPSPTTSMQLRRHPEEWRQISTLTATRLLLNEMEPAKITLWNKLAEYQTVADTAARKQLGPIRLREVKN